MSDITKTIERLKRLHQKYMDEVRVLSAKEAEIAARLAAANELAIQTADAVAALEGKPVLTKLLQDALASKNPNDEIKKEFEKIGWQSDLNLIVKSDKIPESGNFEGPGHMLPAPEPGMVWARQADENGDMQDVLIPQTIPAPRVVPGVVQAIALPAIDENFADTPEDFLQ